jgi:membrane protein DedA with SNARE-associated domain
MPELGPLLTDFFSWMESLSPVWAYLTLLAIAYGENVMPPIPGDLAIAFGGYLVGLGRLDFWPVVGLATLGGAVGFMSMYAIGYRFGAAVTDPERLQWLPEEGIDRARRWIRRYGYGVVAANRFLSGARSVISLAVGMARMSPAWTALWATVSAGVWTTLIVYAGYAVGENWPIIAVYLRTYGRVVLGVLALLGIVAAARWYYQQAEKEPPAAGPDAAPDAPAGSQAAEANAAPARRPGREESRDDPQAGAEEAVPEETSAEGASTDKS